MPHIFQREVASDARELDELLPSLQDFLDQNSVEESVAYVVQLAVEELVLNVINHAYHGEAGRVLSLRVEAEPGEAIIEVEDDGELFDPRAAPEPDFDAILHGDRVGGLGVHLVRSLAASLDYERINGRNRVRVKVLPLRPPVS